MNPTAAHHTVAAAAENAARNGESIANATLDAFRRVEEATRGASAKETGGAPVGAVVATARRTRDRILSNLSSEGAGG